MKRFYAVYSDPTYRDVLELCLRPFAGQIFQSNGALHIRRTVSLYNDTRPMSFYSVGKEFPVGWIITADGQHLETHTGEPIITKSTRERIESMWENDINVQGESVMDIVPAIRKVSAGVKNKRSPCRCGIGYQRSRRDDSGGIGHEPDGEWCACRYGVGITGVGTVYDPQTIKAVTHESKNSRPANKDWSGLV